MLAGMKVTAGQWAEHIRAWRESGLGAEEFAAGKGFTGKLLRWWASEFARRARPTRRPRSKVALARVVRPGEAIADAVDAATTVAIVVGGCRVAVARGFDEGLLRDVIRVLGEAR